MNDCSLYHSGYRKIVARHLQQSVAITRLSGEQVTPKEFRHAYPEEHSKVVCFIEDGWKTIKLLTEELATAIDDRVTTAIIARLSQQAIDGYDLSIVEAMPQAGIRQIIMDDGDFVATPGIQVSTANQNVSNQARNQQQLICR
jgi:hypothetical protein